MYMFSSSDCKAVTALSCLVYLTRGIPNHEKVISFIPASDYFVRKAHNFINNVNLLLDNTELQTRLPNKDLLVPQPLTVIKGSPKEPNKAFLFVDRVVLTKISLQKITLTLMAAFYVFNIYYIIIVGCSNLLLFLKPTFCHSSLPRKPD